MLCVTIPTVVWSPKPTLVAAVCNHWTGPMDWTTGLTFDLTFIATKALISIVKAKCVRVTRTGYAYTTKT